MIVSRSKREQNCKKEREGENERWNTHTVRIQTWTYTNNWPFSTSVCVIEGNIRFLLPRESVHHPTVSLARSGPSAGLKSWNFFLIERKNVPYTLFQLLSDFEHRSCSTLWPFVITGIKTLRKWNKRRKRRERGRGREKMMKKRFEWNKVYINSQ